VWGGGSVCNITPQTIYPLKRMLGSTILIGEGGIFNKPTLCHFDENIRLKIALPRQCHTFPDQVPLLLLVKRR
jgi:hypothetical protein